ncbi:MAG TPA: helix-turn-helix transcriptional regulator [Oligoflexus sp.]|nr:helix-turn-helix transcriptional regulator [Oligoflexus sp.]
MYKQICQSLVNKRLALNILQKELAVKAGISVQTLVKFEAGDEVRVLTLFKIMRALGEFSRLNALVIEEVESPKTIHESKQHSKPGRKRARKK